MAPRTAKNKAVFLDRDGTVIKERFYLRFIKDIQLLPGVAHAMKMLKTAGYKLILVTNQSGIGRGYLTEQKLLKIHRRLALMLKKQGVSFDAVYYCPHHPEKHCTCRKPKLGMVKKAQKRFNLDLKKSYTVGDHTNDFLLGQKMGGTGIMILTGHGKDEFKKVRRSNGKLNPDRVEKDLPAAARWIESKT